MFCGGLWRFVVVCGVLWWFVVFSSTPIKQSYIDFIRTGFSMSHWLSLDKRVITLAT